MTVTLIGAIVIVLGIWAQFRPPAFAAATLCILTLFASSAAMTLGILGHATLVPASAFLPFLLLRCLSWHVTRKTASAIGIHDGATLFTVLFAVYGLASAVILPWAFAGRTEVIGLDRSGGIEVFTATGDSMQSLPRLRELAFNSGNLTQAFYLAGGLVLFLALTSLRTLPCFRIRCGKALLVMATLNIVFAVLDMVTYHTGTAELMSVIRNAGYAQHSANVVEGLKRINGSFTEASAFASYTAALLAFTWSTWLHGFHPRWSLTLFLCSLVLLLLSTSSTGYVVLLLLVVGWLVIQLLRFAGNKASRRRYLVLSMLAGASALAVVYALTPAPFEPVLRLFELTVTNKMEGDSGNERAAMNEQAFTNFLETDLLGAGVGGATASSFVLVLLSNVGLPGAILFTLMVGSLLAFSRPPATGSNPADEAVATATRSAIIAWLLAATLAARVFDLGLFFYFLAGVAAAGTSFQPASPRAWVALPDR